MRLLCVERGEMRRSDLRNANLITAIVGLPERPLCVRRRKRGAGGGRVLGPLEWCSTTPTARFGRSRKWSWRSRLVVAVGDLQLAEFAPIQMLGGAPLPQRPENREQLSEKPPIICFWSLCVCASLCLCVCARSSVFLRFCVSVCVILTTVCVSVLGETVCLMETACVSCVTMIGCVRLCRVRACACV